MEKITVTRALSELKTIEDRIRKHVNTFDPFEIATGEKLKGSHSSMKIADFEKDVKEDKQSLESLIKRQALLKDAISRSNYETKVNLLGEELTIIQVLNRKTTTLKSFIDLKMHLELYLTRAKKNFDSAVLERDSQVEKMVTQEINSSTAGKVSSSEKTDLIEKWNKMIPQVRFLDGCEAEKWLKEIQEYVDEFEHQVDYLLSESNSSTFIELPD